MSVFDKLAAKVMPPESEEERAQARRQAESLATGDDFLRDVLDHHRRIESGFAEAFSAGDAGSRKTALKQLAVILTGHANAEESVLYPAMADSGEKAHAGMGYQEQAMVKIEMAILENLEPMSREWTDKLEHIRDAVAHHMYEEEGTWFPELAQAVPQGKRDMLTKRFREEFARYAEGGTKAAQPVAAPELA